MSDKNMYDKAFDLLLHESLSEVEEEDNIDLPDALDVDFSDEHKAKMKKIFDTEKKKVWKKRFYKSAKRVAACAAVLIIVSGITIMSVSAWRVRFLNFVFNKQQTHTEISADDTQEVGMYETDKVLIGYIPEGFSLTKKRITSAITYLQFDNTTDQVKITMSSSTSIANIDTEDADYEEMLINGETALYAEKEGEKILAVCSEDGIVTIQGTIGREEIVKIARNLKIK